MKVTVLLFALNAASFALSPAEEAKAKEAAREYIKGSLEGPSNCKFLQGKCVCAVRRSRFCGSQGYRADPGMQGANRCQSWRRSRLRHLSWKRRCTELFRGDHTNQVPASTFLCEWEMVNSRQRRNRQTLERFLLRAKCRKAATGRTTCTRLRRRIPERQVIASQFRNAPYS